MPGKMARSSFSKTTRMAWDAGSHSTSHSGFRAIQKVGTIQASSGFIRESRSNDSADIVDVMGLDRG